MLEIYEKIGKILSDCFCVGFTNNGKNDHEKVDNHDKFLFYREKKVPPYQGVLTTVAFCFLCISEFFILVSQIDEL